MNDTENNDITIVINDYEEPFRTGRSGNKPERPRLPIAAKLIALWNLLFELIVGVPFIGIMSIVGDDHGGGAVIFGGLIFAFAHTAISAALFNRYYHKNDVPAWKFVLMNVLPVFIISAVMFLIPVLSELTDVFDIFDLGFVIISGLFGVCFGGYSVVYGVLLSAVLGIGHLIERSRL